MLYVGDSHPHEPHGVRVRVRVRVKVSRVRVRVRVRVREVDIKHRVWTSSYLQSKT